HDVAVDELEIRLSRQLPQCAGETAMEIGRGLGPGAAVERHVVPGFDQGLGEVGDNSLGAAVFGRRDAFSERCYLCNTHTGYPLAERAGRFQATSSDGRRDQNCSMTTSRPSASVCANHRRAKTPLPPRSVSGAPSSTTRPSDDDDAVE